jgi:hypothetical protein
MNVHLITSKEGADTLVRLNIDFQEISLDAQIRECNYAFTHAGLAAGSEGVDASLDSAAFFVVCRVPGQSTAESLINLSS